MIPPCSFPSDMSTGIIASLLATSNIYLMAMRDSIVGQLAEYQREIAEKIHIREVMQYVNANHNDLTTISL